MPSAATASAPRSIRTTRSASGRTRRATPAPSWCRSARPISASPTPSLPRSTASCAATPSTASARCARLCTSATAASCSRWRSRGWRARRGTNRALPCGSPASAACAGTSSRRTPIASRRWSGCSRRARRATRDLQRVNSEWRIDDRANPFATRHSLFALRYWPFNLHPMFVVLSSRTRGDHLMANDVVNRFFGGPPLSVVLRIILLSVVVGVILSALGLDPRDIWQSLVDLVTRIWNMGWDAVVWLWRYFLLGAVIVVPIWLVMRLAKLGRP